LWMLVEQAVQTAFWFHPAMWWVLGQVHLSREQAVDELVVRMTAAPKPYLRALLAFAEGPAAPILAAPFIVRGQLNRVFARYARLARRGRHFGWHCSGRR
jgi:beta-lactamase regulating signal transducer with metallopeptidase domain